MAPAAVQDEEPTSMAAIKAVNGTVNGDKTAGKMDISDTKEEVKANDEEKKDGDTKEESKDKNEDKDKDDEEKDKKKVIVGMDCERKDLYQKWDTHNRFTWTDSYPDDLEEAAENENTEKFAILVRNKKSYDSRKKLEIDSIVIQSPLLKRVLHTVLADYPGVTTTLQRLVFSAPFQPFVHRWEALTAALNGETEEKYDADTKAHLQLLHDLLYAELKDVISAAQDYARQRVVSYEHAWTVFQPGCTILTTRYGRPVANRLRLGQYIEHPRFGPCYELTGDRLEYDGTKFGYDSARVYILPFAGTVPLDSLDAYPLAFHAQPEAVRAMLVERGRRFEQLASGSGGWHYKTYRGVAIEMKENGPVRVTVDSRIVIDAHTHGRFNPGEVTALQPLTKVEAVRKVQAENTDDEFGNGGNSGGFDSGGARLMMGLGGAMYYDCADPMRDGEDVMGFKSGNGSEEDDEAGRPVPLTEDQLLLCSPMVKGFALRSKKWLEFYVDDVADVRYDARAFDRLVLPQGHKQLVLAFAQSQTKNKHRFDDVITGKGQGIILLLSGGPGIGKTLTAESVAETMQVPLVVLSAGDLGMTSYEIDLNLGRVLEMVAKWNAVLLLDECDVFLESRTAAAADLDRNRVVSIFLRTLEYYEGILFLTTNRLRCIDEAFHSRIHVSLQYPDLDAAARRQVWRGFLEAEAEGSRMDVEEAEGLPKPAAASHSVTAADLDRLAAIPINGRQIKNVLKTSHLLAFQLGQALRFEHLQTVLRIQGHEI